MAEIESKMMCGNDTVAADVGSIPIPDIESAVEALLFSSADPLSKDEIARALAAEPWIVDEALLGLSTKYAAGGGLRLVKVAGGWRLETRPEYASYVGRLRQEPPKRLSRAALETIAIIAYRQPITGPEIEQIRGVSTDSSIQLLVERGLVHGVGRKRAPGRPILYATTVDFLTQFGLADLNDLPPIEELRTAGNDGDASAAEENADGVAEPISD